MGSTGPKEAMPSAVRFLALLLGGEVVDDTTERFIRRRRRENDPFLQIIRAAADCADEFGAAGFDAAVEWGLWHGVLLVGEEVIGIRAAYCVLLRTA